MNHKIFIAGAGGIGKAVAILLREWSEFDVEIFLGDVSEDALNRSKDYVLQNSDKTSKVNTVLMPFDGISDEMKAAFDEAEVLLDCSPGSQAPKMAKFAVDFRMHYANLTEYVAETDAIIDIAKDAETGFILQTGLAPGFINVLAVSLYNQFVERYENETVERIGMKVGALSTHAHAPHFYGFTWSPIGVATEYIKTARVTRNGETVDLASLSERERIVINGYFYEADLTSGGAADLPDYFQGKVKDLDYKTLRHVGHYDWVESLIKKYPLDENLPGNLENEMLEKVPSVDEDFVLIHASVDGFDAGGRRRMVEKAFHIKPLEINGHYLRAIQTTTAAPLCESAMMLLSGNYKGIILQSAIEPQEFMDGNFVKMVYKS